VSSKPYAIDQSDYNIPCAQYPQVWYPWSSYARGLDFDLVARAINMRRTLVDLCCTVETLTAHLLAVLLCSALRCYARRSHLPKKKKRNAIKHTFL